MLLPWQLTNIVSVFHYLSVVALSIFLFTFGIPVAIAPSKPENISVLNINQPKAAILLSWQPPLKPNGVITMYQYIIGSSVANVSAENMSVMIGDLGECLLAKM